MLLTHAQRAQRSSSVFLACGRGLYKRVPPHPLITFPSTLMGDDIDSYWSCLEELPQKLDDPDRLRIQYEIAVLQHQQDLVELTLHQVDVIRRRRKRRGHRRFWVRPWIGRRRQFGLYDQLHLELRNEDQASFKNFMRMPPEMFDELLWVRGSPSIMQTTKRPWSETCPHSAASCLCDQVSLNVLWVEGASQYHIPAHPKSVPGHH